MSDDPPVEWPEPREDPDEEPSEPWAKLKDRIETPGFRPVRWLGWAEYEPEEDDGSPA